MWILLLLLCAVGEAGLARARNGTLYTVQGALLRVNTDVVMTMYARVGAVALSGDESTLLVGLGGGAVVALSGVPDSVGALGLVPSVRFLQPPLFGARCSSPIATVSNRACV